MRKDAKYIAIKDHVSIEVHPHFDIHPLGMYEVPLHVSRCRYSPMHRILQ